MNAEQDNLIRNAIRIYFSQTDGFDEIIIDRYRLDGSNIIVWIEGENIPLSQFIINKEEIIETIDNRITKLENDSYTKENYLESLKDQVSQLLTEECPVLSIKIPNDKSSFNIPKRTVLFTSEGEPEEILKLEEGWFWYHGEKIEDVNKAYERFCNWLTKQENNYNGK